MVYHPSVACFSLWLRHSRPVLSYISYDKKQYNYQWWMSWLPPRWRTQQNAIRNVNCRIQWIIRLLNANGALGISLRECMFQYFQKNPKPMIGQTNMCLGDLYLAVSVTVWRVEHVTSLASDAHCSSKRLSMCCSSLADVCLLEKIWNHTRLPTEFKHIIKWRKRN